MNPFRLLRVTRMAVKTLGLHKMRAGLTVLGIIFGVASVIAMLSVGEGLSQEIQEQLQRLGNRNILIKSVRPPQEQFSGGQTKPEANRAPARYGITYEDAQRLSRYVPELSASTPMKSFNVDARFKETTLETGLVATVPWYPQVTNHVILAGRFLSSQDNEAGKPVCVVGARLARMLFAAHDPIGASIRIGSDDVYRVVGVMGDVYTTRQFTNKSLWFVGENQDVYVPFKTYTQKNGDYYMRRVGGTGTFENVDIYELILSIDDQSHVLAAAEVVRELMSRYHKRDDYEIVVPLQLIRQAQETRRLFNIVLGSIAAISLIVGGIGIMNIMLATVSERTREIGIRRALGARRQDIVMQFLIETLLLAILGGIVGMATGAAIPKGITLLTHVRTVLTSFSFVIAFSVSVAVGLIFGIYPARRAALMDPIEALRHE